MIFEGKEHFLKAIADSCKDTAVIYDKNNIVIIKVSSFSDCNRIFCHKTIKWCIANQEYHWNDYVGKAGHEQFFIIDFNKINETPGTKDYNLSLIGFTLKDGKLYAAHARNDDGLLDGLKKDKTGYHPFEMVLKNKGLYNFVIKRKMKGGDNESENNGIIAVILVIVLILLLMTYLAFIC
jgi:hypothetical protein